MNTLDCKYAQIAKYTGGKMHVANMRSFNASQWMYGNWKYTGRHIWGKFRKGRV